MVFLSRAVCVCVCVSMLTRSSTGMLTANIVVVVNDTQLEPCLHGDIREMAPLLCVLQHRAVKDFKGP